MVCLKVSILQDKRVVNINDGKDLGNIVDLEINDAGEILYFYSLPKRSIFKIFASNKEVAFKVKDIKRIGEDVILVELD